jgi:hypothetical protein
MMCRESRRIAVRRSAGSVLALVFTIEVDAPRARFPDFMSQVQRLLDSLRFL